MKILKFFSVTFMLLMVLTMAENSHATDVIEEGSFQGTYLSLNIGGSQLNDESYQAVDLDYNFGNSFGLAIGRDTGEIRYELQFYRAERKSVV